MSDTLAVHARDLRRTTPGRPTLDGVDIDVHFGTVVAVLGPDQRWGAELVRALHGEDHRVEGELLVADTRQLIGHESDPNRVVRVLVPAPARRRVRRISRAVRREVPLLLLVDPFRGLDHRDRDATVGLLRDAVRDRRRAVVLSTTDAEHARAVADRIDVFNGGRIESRIVVDRSAD